MSRKSLQVIGAPTSPNPAHVVIWQTVDDSLTGCGARSGDAGWGTRIVDAGDIGRDRPRANGPPLPRVDARRQP